MHTYELRLFGDDGHVVLVQLTSCATDEEAQGRIASSSAVGFARYEIWQGARKVAEGTNPRNL